MIRKVLLALVILALISQAADARPLRFNLKPKDATSSAQGLVRVVDGKTTDEMVSLTISFSGLPPGFFYHLEIQDANGGVPWNMDIYPDETGSFTNKGTIRGPGAKPILTGKEAQLKGPNGNVIMSGAAE